MGKKRSSAPQLPSNQCPPSQVRGWHVHVDYRWVLTPLDIEQPRADVSFENCLVCSQGNCFDYVYRFTSASEGTQTNIKSKPVRDVKWCHGPKRRNLLTSSSAPQHSAPLKLQVLFENQHSFERATCTKPRWFP